MDSPARPRTPIRRVGLLSRRTGKDKDGWIAVKEGGMNRDKRTINALVFARRDVLALACALILGPGAALADPVGPVTKLPMPRFASLKTGARSAIPRASRAGCFIRSFPGGERRWSRPIKRARARSSMPARPPQ